MGTHNRWKDSSGQLKTRSNQYVIMLGGDVAQWSSSGLDRGHLGLMAGYGNNSSHTHSSATGYGSDGKVHGYNVGIYGTGTPTTPIRPACTWILGELQLAEKLGQRRRSRQRKLPL